MKQVNFKFELYEHVDTPLAAECVITMQAVNHTDSIIYWVENNIQGVANDWWPEAQLASTAERVAQENKA